MKPIKLLIQKQHRYSSGFFRWYPVKRMLLTEDSWIRSEADFCTYLYRLAGPGRYSVLAWQKGKESFWLFWLGNLYEHGFTRDKKKNTYIDKLKGEASKAQSYEEREAIEEEIDFEKDFDRETKSKQRRGPFGLIKSTPGQLHPYVEI